MKEREFTLYCSRGRGGLPTVSVLIQLIWSVPFALKNQLKLL